MLRFNLSAINRVVCGGLAGVGQMVMVGVSVGMGVGMLGTAFESGSVVKAADNADNASHVGGVLNWRGLNQNGDFGKATAPKTTVVDGEGANLLWQLDVPGRGTAVVGEYGDSARLFVMGYEGQGPELLETIRCVDPNTGETIWRKGYADFISDIIYNRYAISAPAIDPETGHVFIQTSPGLVVALDADGNELWQISLMEQYGRLTFPNGRTGCVTIDGDLVIVNVISSNWGSEGPARNRFYAFDKTNGELVWSSDPGVGPPYLKDSSFSTPIFETRQGRRVFYAGIGDGNVVCVDARTGKPIWRYQMAAGGVNSSPVIYDGGTPNDSSDDLVIQVHGKENIDDTGRGYMMAIKADAALSAGIAGNAKGPVALDQAHVAWRNDGVSMFTSSPTLVGDVVYQCSADGHLFAINARTGATQWKQKVGADQLHASPIYAGGLLYVPFWNDGLFVIDPGEAGATKPASVVQTELAGQCIGSPMVWGGKLYVHTTEALYCFGEAGSGAGESGGSKPQAVGDKNDKKKGSVRVSIGFQKGVGFRMGVGVTGVAEGTGTQVMVQPAEIGLRPGESVKLKTHVLGTNGLPVGVQSDALPTWEAWVPPTAKVKAYLDAAIDAEEQALVAGDGAKLSAGAFRVTTADGLHGTMRGRVLPAPPYAEDFESFELKLTDTGDQGDSVSYAHPPLPWIGARMKWQVREDPQGKNGKVLAKTLDRVLFQRSMIFMGHPDDAGYVISADVMSDGNRRGMSVVGVINQRYIIALDGNKQALEVSSNHSRVKIAVPFKWKPKTWYRIKSQVVVNDDGSGVVLGKAWAVSDDEPSAWTIEAKVPNVHTHGSPGLFGFSPQSQYRVYLDNVNVEK